PNIEKLSGSGVITPVLTLMARTLPLPKSATNSVDPITTMAPNAPVVRASGAGSGLVGAAVPEHDPSPWATFTRVPSALTAIPCGIQPGTAQTVIGDPGTCCGGVAVGSMTETDPPPKFA